jgi:DNA-binding NarL/FixJ family response regulator
MTQRIKILVADIHPAFREGLSRLLADDPGLSVVAQAADGAEALSLAGESQPDVVIVDIFITLLDSVELTRELGRVCPDTKVIVVGAHVYESYVIATIKAGAVGYLLKTAPIEEIRRAVYLVQRGGTVFDLAALGTIVQNLRGGAGDEAGHGGLHPRELQVLTLVARGGGNKEIAEQLNISIHTVQSHLSRIFSKLGVSSRTEAVNVALRRRFFTVRDLTQGE